MAPTIFRSIACKELIANEINATNATIATDLMTSNLLVTTIKSSGGNAVMSIAPEAISLFDSVNFVPQSTNGTKFATATTQKMGFWNATPVVQQDVTASGVTAADILAALNTIGILNSV